MSTYNPMRRVQYKTAKELRVEKAISNIQQGTRVLILMRGLPGSGKSYLAKDIIYRALGTTEYHLFIFSTDDYFINPRTGQYRFDPHKLGNAHHSNRMRAIKCMENGGSPIIIDNTNSQIWEMQEYALEAIKHNYFIEIIEPYTKWAFNLNELANRNSHGVPYEKLKYMLDKFDKNVTVEKLLDAIGVTFAGPVYYRGFQPMYSNALPAQNPSNDDFVVLEQQTPTVEFIAISDDESTDHQENTTHGKHCINTTGSLQGSELKKVRTTHEPIAATKSSTKDDKEKNVYPHLNLSSWGLTDNSIATWDEWEVVSSLKDNKIVTSEDTMSNSAQTVDVSTNTNHSDFALIFKEPNTDIKILTSNNRDITKGLCVNPFSPPQKRTLLDKSSMTGECSLEELASGHFNEHEFSHLISLFPNIEEKFLREMYDKCKGNINWTVELLLDSNKEFVSVKDYPKVLSEDAILQETMHDLKIKTNSQVKCKDDGNSIQKHAPLNGKTSTSESCKSSTSTSESCKSSTSPSESCKSSTSHPSTEDTDNSESEIEYPDTDSDSDEIMELDLGKNIITQLEEKLGFEDVMPQDFLPVVQLPISLARQLYATYVESILGQMEVQNKVLETIVKQDEEFALKLQMQEQELENCCFKVTSIPEIMNEQAASNIYQKEVEEWKNQTCDDLATKMSLQKLFAAFPNISTLTISEIYHAYNNSYQETVEDLLSSTGRSFVADPNGTLMTPPISEALVSEMKKAENELKDCMNTPDIPKSAQEYRDEANAHYKKHNELITKAFQAYQKKQYPIAQFYSDVAKSHTQLYDQANSLAASAFLNESGQKLQNFYTLDLHYLYVKEAVAALDMFIDKNIQLLNVKKTSENLFIITGQGKRSEQGKSKLKPVIMTRLRKRKIRYWEINPGLLKIHILRTSLLTSDLSI